MNEKDGWYWAIVRQKSTTKLPKRHKIQQHWRKNFGFVFRKTSNGIQWILNFLVLLEVVKENRLLIPIQPRKSKRNQNVKTHHILQTHHENSLFIINEDKEQK